MSGVKAGAARFSEGVVELDGGDAGAGEAVVESKEGLDSCLPNNIFGVVEKISVFFVFWEKGKFPNIDGVPLVAPKGEGEDEGKLG